MIITAKFSSVCPCCSVRIVPGTPVEWTKGSPARHPGCKGKSVQPTTRRQSTRRERYEPFGVGSPSNRGTYYDDM